MVVGDTFQEPNYSQESNFRTGVTNLFNNYSGTSGTVRSITSGDGISLSSDPITISGTISLDANLDDLNDVSITAPVTNQVLAYDGANWVNQAVNEGTSLQFTALTDTPNSLSGQNGSLLAVGSNGTSIVFIDNDYKNNIIAGTGIDVIANDNDARILFNSDSILTASSSANSDYYIIENSSGNRRIQQSNIDISGFNNDSAYLTNTNIIGTSPIQVTTVGNQVTIGLSRGEFEEVNFNNGVTGILNIDHGGTSASNANDARSNLGLAYNIDILTQSGPSFDNNMFGDNILLQPSSFGLSINDGGQNYLVESATLTLTGYEPIPIEITGIGAEGNITSWTATSGGLSYLARGNYPYDAQVWQVVGSGTDGEFLVTPEINYLNFGTSHVGQDSIGLRNNRGLMEIRSEGQCWQSIFPMTTDKISDIVADSASTGDILIYNGNSWLAQEMTGFLNINSAGLTSYGAGVDSFNPVNISANGASISADEFSTLSGMSSNRGTIQAQLDSKVGSNVASSTGDLIYYDTSGTCFWTPIPITAERQILNSSTGTSPQYDYLRNILTTTSTTGPAASMETVLLNSTDEDHKIAVYEIFNTFTDSSTNGIDLSSGNDLLELNINNLNADTTLAASDELAYFDTGANITQKITVNNFCNQISGTGLTANSGTLNLTTPLNLGSYTFGTSPAGVDGDLTYFSDGNNGEPCLGLYVGTCWRIIALGSGINPGP